MPKKLPDGTVVYDFSTQHQLRASRILYKYLIEELNSSVIDEMKNNYKEIEDVFHVVPQRVNAFEYDLNDDGENEIIGFINSSAYWGTAGFQLFILKKRGNKYEEITEFLNFEPQINFYINPQKKNGFKNIVMSGSSAYDFKPMLVTYNGENYYSKEQKDLFIEYLKKYDNYDVSELTKIK